MEKLFELKLEFYIQKVPHTGQLLCSILINMYDDMDGAGMITTRGVQCGPYLIRLRPESGDSDSIS